jgi:hypothetical protein
MISKEDIADAERLIEILDSMTAIVKRYKSGKDDAGLKYLLMYYKNLVLELFTHWI